MIDPPKMTLFLRPDARGSQATVRRPRASHVAEVKADEPGLRNRHHRPKLGDGTGTHITGCACRSEDRVPLEMIAWLHYRWADDDGQREGSLPVERP